jgi:2-polyprenyl-3-methyl-5-hydroxy-6-metoxy-1,4-benzoquinol methylase
MSDQGSEGLFSPFLRARRIGVALHFLRGRVLDFGCGAGALAALIDPRLYLGFDRDDSALALARSRFPRHRFVTELPEQERFNTIAALAVVEHLPEPEHWLRLMLPLLAAEGRIVITTPHPAFRPLHEAGARAGLFSRQAAAEHETLFNRAALLRLAVSAGFELVHYRRFLLGANQLAVMMPRRFAETHA